MSQGRLSYSLVLVYQVKVTRANKKGQEIHILDVELQSVSAISLNHHCNVAC